MHDTGSLRQAAEALHVTQPAVTAMLRDLETSFGAHLVERGRRGAQLTASGEVLRERFLRVGNELADAAASVAAAAERHYLRVGVLPIAVLQLVPEAEARLRAQGARITLKLVDGTVGTLLQALLAGELDCVVGRLDPADTESVRRTRVVAEPILQMPLQVAAAAKKGLAPGRRSPLGLEQLAAREWVLPRRGSGTRTAFDHGFLQAGLTPPAASVEALTFFSSFELVARTDLLTIAPALAVGHYQRLGLVRGLQLRWPVPLPPLALIRRAGDDPVSSLQAFRSALLQAAAALQPVPVAGG